MLTTTDDVELVLFDNGGVIAGARPGCLVIDMGTVSTTATRDFAARLSRKGIDMLDAPVSGGPEGARNATLTVMVGGKPEVFQRPRPLAAAVTMQNLNGLMGRGRGRDDLSSLVTVVEDLCASELN